MGKIGIIIPIYNGLDFTKKCLYNLYDSFKLNNIPDNEIDIIIVDDGSTDGSNKWISDNYPKVNILEGTGDLWWSGAMNMGARYSIEQLKNEYILLWNNDILTDKNYFSELLRLVGSEDKNVIIGSKIFYDSEFTKIWAMGGIFNRQTGRKYLIAFDRTDSSAFSEVVDADWLPGMGTLVHKDVIRKIGLWDETAFPQYHGDSDFTFRAKLAGFKIKVYPRLRIYNDKEQSGILHNGKLKLLFRSFVDIKSNFNIKKDFLFYRKYATSIKAYIPLLRKYYLYVGGFIKWKILNIFGIKKIPSKV